MAVVASMCVELVVVGMVVNGRLADVFCAAQADEEAFLDAGVGGC